jgi:hypothetical protein
MKLVYTHPNSIVVGQARSAIELAGIACSLRNEYASGAIGELAPIDASHFAEFSPGLNPVAHPLKLVLAFANPETGHFQITATS